MTDRKDKKREAPISYRPPKHLRDEFYSRVQKSGLSTSAFLTKAIFNQTQPRQSRRPSIETKLLAKILGEAAKIHGDLQELSTSENEDIQAEIGSALDELSVIRAALLKGLGRNP